MVAENGQINDYKNSHDGLLLFSDTSRFPYIPKQLPKYVEACISKGRTNRLCEAVKDHRIKVFENIDRAFQLASEATGLTPDKLLQKTDFNPRDMLSTRLDSAFAEIRTINFLKEEGFENIQLLNADERKRADISGVFWSKAFAVEVINSIFSADKRVEPYQLKEWLVRRVLSDKKLDQLVQTSKEVFAERTVLIGVIDTFPAVAYNTHNDCCEAAKLTWKELGSIDCFHVAFVTGSVAQGYGRDDCVFPHWA